VEAVVFPCKVEEAVAEVGEEATLIDREAFEGAVTVEFGVGAFPEEFAGIRHDATSNRQVRHFGVGDAARQEVQLEARDGVAGVGAAVHFHDGAHRIGTSGGFTEFVDDLKDDAAFSLVTG
jgi:hypothetical protein